MSPILANYLASKRYGRPLPVRGSALDRQLSHAWAGSEDTETTSPDAANNAATPAAAAAATTQAVPAAAATQAVVPAPLDKHTQLAWKQVPFFFPACVASVSRFFLFPV